MNMPEEMYESIKKCLPKLTTKIKMPLMDRRAVAAAKGEAIEGEGGQFEYIYIWKKSGKADFEKQGCGVAP